MDGTARITAQAEGYASALATVVVRSKALVLPSSVIVAPNGQTTVTLEATEPAPASGLAVALALEQAGLAQTPASVQIPAGQSKATFVVQGQSLGTTNLTATAAGYQPAATVLRVDAISLNTDPSADLVMSEELTRTIRVLLNKAAPPGGVTASVGTRDSAIATATPAEVFIPQGQIYGTVPVSIKALAIGTTAIDIAAPGLVAKVVNVDVREKFGLTLTRYGGSKLILGKGLYNYVYEFYVQRLINGVVSNGADAVTVNLRCVAEDVCKAPATVTIPAGQSTAYIQVTGVGVGTTQIVATAEGAAAAVPMPVEVIQPQLVIHSLDGQRTTSSLRDDFSFSLQVPGASYSGNQYTASPLAINLSLTDQAPAGVVNGIYSAGSAGSLITQLTIPKDNVGTGSGYIAQPSTAGTYRLSAEIVGLTSAKSEVQTVLAATQALTLTRYGGSKLILGKGLYNYVYEFYVQRLINGVVSNGADAVTVNLRCVAEDVCKAPATVTIPAGQSTAYIQVTGVGVGTTQIEATAEGATAAAPMPVEVIQPQLVINSLDGQRTTSSLRDNFSVSLRVPGAAYADNQYTASPLSLNLSLTDQAPAGVVNGIYSAGSGGSLITQLMIEKDNAGTSTAYIAQPSVAGSYRLSVEIAGLTSAKSEVQTVLAASQSLRLVRNGGSKLILGKGLYSYYYEFYVERLINGVVSGGADPVTVSLRCVAEDVCKAPASVTIPAGQSYAYISVTGVGVGTTQIEATAAGSESAVINVETVAPVLRLYNVPSSQNVGQQYGSIYVNADVSGATYPTNQYPESPIEVTLTSSVPSVGTITKTVTWGANAGNSGTAMFTAVAQGTTQITASTPGFTPATSAPITVNP